MCKAPTYSAVPLSRRGGLSAVGTLHWGEDRRSSVPSRRSTNARSAAEAEEEAAEAVPPPLPLFVASNGANSLPQLNEQ